MSYKHGIYGIAAVTNSETEVAQGTVPAYIGTAPIHRINTNGSSNFDYSQYVNKPILISSLREAKEMGLYSDDWGTYSLSEAIHAHFMNGEQAVAPIVLLNMLNPEEAIGDTKTEKVTMKKSGTSWVGYINNPRCLLDEIAITEDNLDGSIESTACRYDGDTVVIEAKANVSSLYGGSFTAEVTYKEIFVEGGASTVAFVYMEGALSALDYCEQLVGIIPNIVAAPGISEVPEHHELMIQKAMDKISGKWNFICVSDIPASNTTYADAKSWKVGNAYDSKYDKVCWPAVAHGDKIYHLSTIVAYMMQRNDAQNGDVPYVSPSNKVLFCDRAIVNPGLDEYSTFLISEEEANDANQVGITTVNSVKRTLRLWGAHMANYNYAKIGSIAAEERFDSSIRMTMYLLNYLQYQYIAEIDQSFTRKDIDSIANSVQTWLDSLVNDNMLLYAAVSFNNESNSDADIANGDFVFDLEVTYGVIAKSITFKLQYTSAGIVALTTDGGAE